MSGPLSLSLAISWEVNLRIFPGCLGGMAASQIHGLSPLQVQATGSIVGHTRNRRW